MNEVTSHCRAPQETMENFARAVCVFVGGESKGSTGQLDGLHE